jgi:hypothetical protein
MFSIKLKAKIKLRNDILEEYTQNAEMLEFKYWLAGITI